MTLPEKGWQRPCPIKFGPSPNWACIQRVEMGLEIAEYRLRHDGIKPELVRYIAGIGEAVR